jgi:hypothetical protein
VDGRRTPPMGSGHSTGAVDEEEEEPGPTPIPTSTTGLGSGEDTAYQEIVANPPQEAVGMEPPRGAVGLDATGGSPAAGAVGRGRSVTTGAQRGARADRLRRQRECCINHQSQLAENRWRTQGWVWTRRLPADARFAHNTTRETIHHKASTHQRTTRSRCQHQQAH